MTSINIYSNKEHSVAKTDGGLNVGTSNEKHAPIGEGNSGWEWKQLLRFPLNVSDFGGITQITSATLKIRTTVEQHCTNDNGTKLEVRGLQSHFAATGGGSSDASDSWKTSADPVWGEIGGWTAILGSREGVWANGTVYEIDITDYVEKYAPSSILKRDGSPCDNETNYGMLLQTDGTAGESVEFNTLRGAYNPRILVEGTTTPVPNAPEQPVPIGSQSSVPVDGDFEWYGDASNDENPLTAYDYAIKDLGTSYTPPTYTGGVMDADTLLENQTAGISGVDVIDPTGLVAALAGAISPTTIQRGHWYSHTVRHKNSEGVYGDWSAVSVFRVLNIPDTPTLVNPTSSKPYAHVENLDEAAVWSDSGGEAYAELKFQYNHPDGDAMQAYTIDWAGTEYTVSLSAEDGETLTVQSPTKIARDTATSYRVKVQDVNDNWSAYTASFNTRVQWAQGILSHNHGSGAGNFEFDYSGPTGGDSSRIAVLFKESADATWYANLGDVPFDTTLDILIRMCTDDSTNNPSVDDLTLTYLGTGNLAPDLWAVSGTGATMVLDPTRRRFGKRSAKVVIGSAETEVYPTYGTSDPYIIVTPGERYTFSIFINVSDPITAPVLRFRDGSDTILESTSQTIENNGTWERITQDIVVPEGVTRIRPSIVFAAADSGDTVWLDSAQFEEGEVATQWKPGGIGPAVSIDVGGIQVDAEKGGVFRLLSGDGDTSVYSSTNGLTFKDQATGNTAELGVDSSGNLEVDGTDVSLDGHTHSTTDPVVNVYEQADSPATWTKDAGLKYIIVEVVGGGGGGGACPTTSSGEQSAAGGGGGAGYSRKLFLASELPATCTATIGSGGGGGTSGGNGSAGGNSTFAGTGITTVQGNGGSGGNPGGTSSNNRNEGGAGGEASGGDLNAAGQGGGLGSVIGDQRVPAGAGGNAGNGSGGARAANNTAGYNATGYGGGGSGSSLAPSSTGRGGGDGADGVVIVTEFYG